MADISQIKLPDGNIHNIVDNTSGYITAESPALTGTPTAPTPLSEASDTQIATVKYVRDSMAGAGAGSVTSVGVANAIEGGLSISGSPITGAGTITVGHSNVLASAQTTAGIYPIKIDKNGHISEYGNAVTIPEVPTNVSSFTNDSGYITTQYIEDKTDYEIPVSRVGEIIVGETPIGTDSTNFPTSKAVVDYVDERVTQEIAAIDFEGSITDIKANGTSLPINNGVVNIPAIGPGQSVGLITDGILNTIYNNIPTSTSQLTNDSGYVVGPNSSVANHIATFKGTDGKTIQDSGYTIAKNVPSNAVFTDEKVKSTVITSSTTNNYPILLHSNTSSAETASASKTSVFYLHLSTGSDGYYLKMQNAILASEYLTLAKRYNSALYYTKIEVDSTPINSSVILTLPKTTGTIALTSDIPTVPTNISAFTNDSGYLTASDIASVMTYKGTKANYAALPSIGNTIGDVWHLTDTGAEWAWDGSAWQELGSAIDLSNYLTTSDVAAWARASTKPTYTAAEVGALPDTTTIPSKTSDLTNDSNFIQQFKVTITGNDGDGYSADKTLTELVTAYNNGYEVVCQGPFGSMIPVLEINSEHALFELSAMTTQGIPAAEIVTISNNNAVSYSMLMYEEAEPDFNTSPAAGIAATDISNWNKKTAIWTVSSENASGDYWWTLAISRSALYKITNAPGTDGYLKSIKVPSINGSQMVTLNLPTTNGQLALTSQIPTIPTNISAFTNDAGYITSYTETDPVFTASAAAGITATDINNWNAKVSDDKTWNGVTLDKSSNVTYGGYVPRMSDTTDTTAKLIAFSTSPTSGRLSQYDNNAYLNSTTPSVNDNSTKVATTAYVNAVIPDTSSFVSKSGDTMTGNLIMDGNDSGSKFITFKCGTGNNQVGFNINGYSQSGNTVTTFYGGFTTPVRLSGISTPSNDADAANKQYVDNKFNTISVPTKTSDLTNDSGFITTDSDEKLAITQVVNNSSYYPIFGSGSTAATRLYDNNLTYTTQSNRIILALGASNDKKGIIQIYSKNGTGSTQLSTDNTSGVALVSLPDKGGTIALTDDIPKVYSSTNTGGYLTMATLPIYDGTVV